MTTSTGVRGQEIQTTLARGKLESNQPSSGDFETVSSPAVGAQAPAVCHESAPQMFKYRFHRRIRPGLFPPTTNTSFSTTSMVTSTLSTSLGRALRSAARYPVRFCRSRSRTGLLTTYTSAPPTAVVCDCSQHPPPSAADDNALKWAHGSNRGAPTCADGDGGRVDRCGVEGGDGRDEWHGTLPRAHGIQGHQPSLSAPARALR